MLRSRTMSEIEVSLQNYPNTKLVGLHVRTRNEEEMKPGSGKIAGLWESFYQNIFPKVTDGASVYGLYSNYESDHNGYYDLSAAVSAEHLAEPSDACVLCEVRAGAYLRFVSKNPKKDPVEEVMGLWQRVWAHFADEKSEQQRAYSSDFELYCPGEAVELFVAVK